MPNARALAPQRMPAALPSSAALLALCCALLAGCDGPSVPDTTPGLVCKVDDDCDPGDDCVGGHCKGSSAGTPDAGAADAGLDAGLHDAGPADAGGADGGETGPDAGALDGGPGDAGLDAGADDAGVADAGALDAGVADGGPLDAGSSDAGAADAGPADAGSSDAGALDAGPAPQGRLTLSPGHTDLSVQAGAQAAAVALTAGNTGDAPLHFTASCTGGASALPSSGAIAPGAAASLTVTFPVWSSAGPQSLTCTLASADAAGAPAAWTAAITVLAAPGAIGPEGGTVDLLNFVFTGDTRPTTCDATANYPAAAFRTIVSAMPAVSPQFGLDLGDHMFVCSGGLATAQAQMKLYTDALAAGWPQEKPWFMTMGNHECNSGGAAQVCGTSDVNYVPFHDALVAVSKHDNPNYKLDLQTRLGLVRILVLADNQATQADVAQAKAWMNEADQLAKAVFIAKHHTVAAGSRTGPAWVLTELIDNHRVTAILAAHDHKYYTNQPYVRSPGTLGGSVPAVICGLGAANTNYRGFCRMQQKADGSFDMTHYDDAGMPHEVVNYSGLQ
jgi:Calcineurin-like phosphoesterase